MVEIQMHENDLKNLNEFLERVELKGKTEAIALVKITNELSKAKKVEKIEKDGE